MRPCLKLLDAATAANGKPTNTAATGQITAALGSTIVTGSRFTLDDGINPAVTFVFDSAATVPTTATQKVIAYTSGDSAATVKAAIIAAINAVTTALRITATDGGGALVTLTNDLGGLHGNNAIANTTTLAITGMTGGVTVGFPLNGTVGGGGATTYHWRLQDAGAFMLQSVAGSGTMDVTVRIYVYTELTKKWAPMGIATTMPLRGVLNDGVTITEDGPDNLTHTEPVQYLSAWDYIYAEIVSINGVATAVDLYLNSCARQQAV